MWMAHDQGMLGRLNHITAQWHRNNYWRRAPLGEYTLNDEEKKFIDDLDRHWNWRMYKERSGGLYTELMTHQSDIANWFMRAVPTQVFASGSIDYWRDGREVEDNIVAVFKYEQRPNMPGFRTVERRSQLQNMPALNNRPYEVHMEYSSILMNAKRGAMEMIHGDLGTVTLTEKDCWFYVEPEPWAEREAREKAAAAAAAGEEKSAEEQAAAVTSGASLGLSNTELTAGKELLADKKLETADVYQFRAFAHHIRNGGEPRSNQMTGLTTSITSIAAIQSVESGKPVDIDPAWYTFDFAVPSFHDFHWEDVYEDLPAGSAPATPPPAPGA
jgi:predicted dehydrogenase